MDDDRDVDQEETDTMDTNTSTPYLALKKEKKLYKFTGVPVSPLSLTAGIKKKTSKKKKLSKPTTPSQKKASKIQAKLKKMNLNDFSTGILPLTPIGVTQLHRYGYIDHLSSPPPAIDEDWYPVPASPRDAHNTFESDPERDVADAHEMEKILHPIFRRRNFLCSNRVYDVLLPCLKLASCFLNEPTIQPFFHGLARQDGYTAIPGLESKFNGRNAYSFREFPDIATAAEMGGASGNPERHVLEAWKLVARLKDSVRFKFDKQSNGVDACTIYDWKRAIWGEEDAATGEKKVYGHGIGGEGTTFPVVITIEENHISAITAPSPSYSYSSSSSSSSSPSSYTSPSSPAIATLPHIKDYDPIARHQRAILTLSITLVHEITHALHICMLPYRPCTKAYLGHPILHTPFRLNASLIPHLDPFYRAHRIAEPGFALEHCLFSATLCSTGAADPRVPWRALVARGPAYGLVAARFPGGMHADADADVDASASADPDPDVCVPVRATAARVGRRWATYYAVPTTFAHAFFTRRFWSVRVAAQGLRAYAPARFHGVRRPLGGCSGADDGDVVVDEQLREPESPIPEAGDGVMESAAPVPVEVN